MKLALFLNIRFYFDGENYTADERYYQFWTSLTRYFEKVVLCVPVITNPELRGQFDVDLKGNHVEICHLPISGIFGVHRLPKIQEIVSANIHQWDIVGAVVPSLVGLFLLYQAKRLSTPCFGYIRGNVKKTAWFGLEGPKRWVVYTIYSILDVLTKKFFARSGLAFVVGHDLYERYRKENNAVFEIVVSVISEDQIKGETAPSNVSRKPRLFYVGRLSSEKGLPILMEGVVLFKKKYGCDFELTIAGSGPDEYRMKDYARKLGISDAVRFLGYVNDGADLAKLYLNSDIFILPSYTEGVPKVILEAMANGVPVVSTAVGGIPEIIQNDLNGLLIPPGNAGAICDSIYQVWSNSQLRSKLIKSGYETVKKYTIEKQAANIVNLLERHYNVDLMKRNLTNGVAEE